MELLELNLYFKIYKIIFFQILEKRHREMEGTYLQLKHVRAMREKKVEKLIRELKKMNADFDFNNIAEAAAGALSDEETKSDSTDTGR